MVKQSTLRVTALVVSVVLVLFTILSFSSPFVPLSRVTIEGAGRIKVENIYKFLESKKSLGMVSTSDSVLEGASEELGVLLESIDINPTFFFSAVVKVTEKVDTFAIIWGPNPTSKIVVDSEGNHLNIPPTENKTPILQVGYKKPGDTYSFEIPNPDHYPLDVGDGTPAKSNYHMLPVVKEIMTTRDKMPLNFTRVIYNESDSLSFDTISGEVFVSSSESMPKDGPEAEEGDEEVVERPSSNCTYVNLESSDGIFCETSQGTVVFLGDSGNLDLKFGALAKLVDSLKLDNRPLPSFVKLDIPFQVTTVDRNAGG